MHSWKRGDIFGEGHFPISVALKGGSIGPC